jgi:hypothetical protein
MQKLASGKNLMNNYSSFIISHRPEMIPAVLNSVSPESVKWFNGTGYRSFSKLVNACVASADTEIIIIMSDKVFPTQEHIKKVVDLVNQGYGFVALYRFALFGFKKQLMRQIGMMDERFAGGGFEDDDFYIRLHEANISMYITEEIPYLKSHSSWDRSLCEAHFINKWVDTTAPNYDPAVKLSHNIIKRNLPEEQYSYNLGPGIPTAFLPWDYTYCPISKPKKYMRVPKRPKGK